VASALRDRLGRTIRVGLNSQPWFFERPFQGRTLVAPLFPRPSAWADGSGLSGQSTLTSGTLRRAIFSSITPVSSALDPIGVVPSAQGAALGSESRCVRYPTLKGSFIDAYPVRVPNPFRPHHRPDEKRNPTTQSMVPNE
jgi:hypothetical protein